MVRTLMDRNGSWKTFFLNIALLVIGALLTMGVYATYDQGNRILDHIEQIEKINSRQDVCIAKNRTDIDNIKERDMGRRWNKQ